MNIPNIISVLRILSVPLLVILLMNGRMLAALLVFFLAGLSDAIDGFLARLLKQKTAIGAFIDPLADKLLLNTSYITLAILEILPNWLAVLVVSRDVIILMGFGILFLTERPVEVKPTIDSKVNTAVQLACVLYFLAHDYLMPGEGWDLTVLFVTAFFTLLSGFRYICIGFKALGTNNVVPPPKM